MRFLLIVCTFLLSGLSTFAAKTTLQGVAMGQGGRQIAAFVPKDYISGQRALLAITTIGQNGDFKLEWEQTETHEVQLVLLHLEGIFYAEPGHSYQIIFPAAPKDEPQKLDRTEVSLVFENLPEHDLNNLITRFDADYELFIQNHFYDFAVDKFKGNEDATKSIRSNPKVDMITHSQESDSLKKMAPSQFDSHVATFFDETQKKYSPHYSNAFFREYVRYAQAEVELVSGLSEKKFYRSYFEEKPIQHLNPTYMRVFKLVYQDFLTDQPKSLQSGISKAINTQFDGIKLIDLLKDDSTALNQDLRSLACVWALKGLYFNKTYTRAAIEKTLYSIQEGSGNEMVRKTATATRDQLRKGRAGWEQQDFVLLDQKQEKWHLSDTEGMPVYILFYASWSTAAMKEMAILEKLQSDYGKVVRIVAISMDQDFEAMKKYMRDHPKQNFQFVYGYGDILLKEMCSVKSVPHAILLDKNGLVKSDFTQLPSQGIQQEFSKILVESQKPGQQGVKTWNGRN